MKYDYSKLILFMYIIIGMFCWWLFKTPSTPKNYLLPTWEKPLALCRDKYFSWNYDRGTCSRHGGVIYWFMDN